MGWSENWPSPTIGSFYAYPSKIDFHTKFHQNWTKIVEVSQSHVVGGVVGWLGWLGGSNFFYRLISQADCQDKAQYKISTQYLKAFRSYQIAKLDRRRRRQIHIQHQPLANYSPRRNLFRRGQKIVKKVFVFSIDSGLHVLSEFSQLLSEILFSRWSKIEPHKISTQYLKAFRSYPIVKVSYRSGCWVGG